MKTTLYELKNIYLNLLNLDLESEDLQKALESIDDEIEVKAENYAKVIKNLEHEAEAYDTEIKRMTANKKALKNRADYLKKNLEEAMVALDKKKFKTTLFSFSIQKNPASLNIIDEDKIPEDYYRLEKVFNKNDIKEALKNGLLTEAAELVQSESLRIR